MSKTPNYDAKVKTILDTLEPGERTCELTGEKWEMTEEEIGKLVSGEHYLVLPFVSPAYSSGAIDASEVRQWAWRVMEMVKEADVVRLPIAFST